MGKNGYSHNHDHRDVKTKPEVATALEPAIKSKAVKGIMDSDYARNKRQLMDLINQIRSTGASLDVDLPTIVVAGNQSSGKSSLIEAISGIKLPRAAGTCTRVPIEVRLRREEGKDWVCVVKIRQEIDEGEVADRAGQAPEAQFGLQINDPEIVEIAIRRAQLAILNPSVDAAKFVDYDIPEQEVDRPLGSMKQLAFSRNVVVLEISGPEVTDLTLVDLPGIVQNVGKGEDKSNIQLVEDLVKHYISKDSLILLVLTMKDDPQNQKAALLASEVDPDCKRTIGVLTKADTLQGREVDQWLKLLKNESDQLLHGYYVTRQPNADELADQISFDTARARELDFFAKASPWNTLSPQWKARLGTRNLTASLSEQLLSFIREKLPALVEQINLTYDRILNDIESLPAEPSVDSSAEMMGLVEDFSERLGQSAVGAPNHEFLIQSINAAYLDYKQKVWATAPRFTPFTKDDINEDETKRMSKIDFLGDVEGVKEVPMGAGGLEGRVLDLDDVREHVTRSITRELPNNVPFAAKASLIREATQSWEPISEGLLNKIQPLVEKLIHTMIAAKFGRYKEGMLPSTVHGIIKDQIKLLSDNAGVQIRKLIKLEMRPFTMNDHDLIIMREKFLAHLKDKRYPKPVSQAANKESLTASALQYLAALGYTSLDENDLKKLLKVDSYETELAVMAETRAYWQVAYKRIIDDVPRQIDAELIIPLAKTIKDALIHGLSIFDAAKGRDRCRAFLAESPMTTRQREDLVQRRDRLGQAKEAVKTFGLIA